MCDLLNKEYEVKSSLLLVDAIRLLQLGDFDELRCESTEYYPWLSLIEFEEFCVSGYQAMTSCWSVRKPKRHPAELQGFKKDFQGVYKKACVKDVWVNVFYNKNTTVIDTSIYQTRERAQEYASSTSIWIFVKTLHLSQQYSITWQDDFNTKKEV